MASRKYYRDSRGRFHGSAGSAAVTYGKAGGFANGAFRSRLSAGRMAPANPSGPRASRTSRLGHGIAKGARFVVSKEANRAALRVGVGVGAVTALTWGATHKSGTIRKATWTAALAAGSVTTGGVRPHAIAHKRFR